MRSNINLFVTKVKICSVKYEDYKEIYIFCLLTLPLPWFLQAVDISPNTGNKEMNEDV